MPDPSLSSKALSPNARLPNERRGGRLFTAGAVLLLIMGAVHSLSFIKGPVPANDTERQLLDLMSNYKFNLLGSQRSMDNLMTGFSISFMLAAFGFGSLDFLLRREPTQLLKRVALVNTIWLTLMTAVSLRYFFAAPTSFLVAALLIFLLATLTLPSTSSN